MAQSIPANTQLKREKLPIMDEHTQATQLVIAQEDPRPTRAKPDIDALVEDVVIYEVTVDGMCGVY